MISAEANEKTVYCASALLGTVQPALTILSQHGITHLRLMVWIADGHELESAILWPRFDDPAHVMKKHRDAISAAVRDVSRAVVSAIEAEIADAEESQDDEQSPTSFLAIATVGQNAESAAWSIGCEIVATVADDHPDLWIEFR